MNYKLAEKAWRRQHGLPDKEAEEEAAKRLRALRPSLKQLRKSYRTNSVQVAYEGSTAEAYLLGYVPLYIHQAEAVLSCALPAADLSGRDELRVGLLFPGPGPELIALVRKLRDLNMVPELRITYFDIANHGWAMARRELLRCADGIYPSYESEETFISEETIDIDLCSDLSPGEIKLFSTFDILIAQNMANEIANSQQALVNLAAALTSAKPGTLVVLSDQQSYVAARKLEEVVTQRLDPHFEVVHNAMPSTGQKQLCESFKRPPTPLLAKNFFQQSPMLWPRKAMKVVEWVGVKRPERRI